MNLTAERIEELREWTCLLPSEIRRDVEALLDAAALRAEPDYAALKQERDKWKGALEKAIRESEHYNAVRQERDSLRAEVEQLRGWHNGTYNEGLLHRAEQAEAELERVRPLIQAAIDAEVYTHEETGEVTFYTGDGIEVIEKAALAYRAKKEGK